jgi:putative transposase
MTTLRYNFRLRPGAQAVESLFSEWHSSRWLWNQMATSRKQALPFFKGSDLTAARARFPWLRAGSQNVQEQTMQTFAGKGKRNFKKKKELPSLQYSRNGFSIKDGRLRLAGGILIPVVWHRELPSIPSSVRVVQDSLGHWYASFVVEVEETFLPEADTNIGIDWGVASIATTTDPAYDFESPQFAKASATKLAKYQRRMARRKPKPGAKASRGYREAKRDAAKLHKKVARQRQHTSRQWARNVVTNHQLIAVEGFRTKFLFQTTMARKAADNAVGQAKRELINYAQRAGRNVVIVPPAYTTMTCSQCAAINKQRMALSERIFTCETCNYTAGRDRNAAKTILVQAENNLTNVETIRHATTPQGDLLRAS